MKRQCEWYRMELVPTNQKKAKRLSKGRIKELSERRTSWGVNEILKMEGAQVPTVPPILPIIFSVTLHICHTNFGVVPPHISNHLF